MIIINYYTCISIIYPTNVNYKMLLVLNKNIFNAFSTSQNKFIKYKYEFYLSFGHFIFDFKLNFVFISMIHTF